MTLLRTEMVRHFVNMLAQVEPNYSEYTEKAGPPEDIFGPQNTTICRKFRLEITQQKYADDRCHKMYGKFVKPYLFVKFYEAQTDQAKLLLQDEAYSITAVANHLGYHSLSHFSRAFKKQRD